MGSIPEQIPVTLVDRFISYLGIGIDSMIQMEMKFTEKLDIERLQKAVSLSFNAEPILGCRLVKHWHRPFFQRINGDSIEAFHTTESIEEFDAFRNMLIDPYQGPQQKVYHYHSSEEDRLLFKVTHDITDAGGFRRAVYAVSYIYSRLKDNPAYEPPPNINASRGLKMVTRQLKWHAYPRIFLNYLRASRAERPRQGTHTLSFGESPLKPLEIVHKLIPKETVVQLKEYGHSHHATLHYLVIAAIFHALITHEKWNQQSHLQLMTTVDWRRWYVGREKGEVIANLSGLEVISLKDNISYNFLATLGRVTDFFEKRKSCYIGLNVLIPGLILGQLPDKSTRKIYNIMTQSLINHNNLPVGFTNMAEIEADFVTFDYPPDSAWLIPPPYYPPNFLFGLSGYKGTLSLTSHVRPSHKESVTQFFENIVSQLPVQCK